MMKRSLFSFVPITHRPMAALTLTAVCTRIFYLAVIDTPEILNAGWLMIFAGGILSLPVMVVSFFLLKKYGAPLENGIRQTAGETGFRLICFLAFVIFTFEANSVIEMLTDTAGYAVYYSMHSKVLMLATAVAIIYASVKGGNGIGGAAQLWLSICPFLYALVIVFQAKNIHVRYLMPLLGPGADVLIKKSLMTVLYYCMIPLSFMIDTGYNVHAKNKTDKIKPSSILILYGLSVLIPMILLLLHSCFYPSLPINFSDRTFRWNQLISAGKAVRSVQLPILILWFSSAFLTGAYMIYCGGRMLMKMIGKEHGSYILVPGVFSAIMAFNGLGNKRYATVFPLYSGMILFSMLIILPAAGKVLGRFSRSGK